MAKDTVTIEEENIFELKAKVNALNDLKNLDSDVLIKLTELAKNPNAVRQIKKNFQFIKSFLNN